MSDIAITPQGAPVRRADGYLPIADYALLSDCHSAALVGRDGSIDWLCLPRFDSPAVFARILDPDAGHWSIAPADEDATAERRYVPGTLVVETTFRTATGTARVTDAMLFRPGQRGHEVGRRSPHELVRLVEGVEGKGEMTGPPAPRRGYGLVRPLIRMTGDDAARTFGGPNQIAVRGAAAISVADAAMHSTFTLMEGDEKGFSLHWAAVEDAAPEAAEPGEVRARIEDT